MTLFCLDTSTREGSMALWRDGAAIGVVHPDARSHAERLPVEAITWLASQGVTLADLDALAVVAGPGSFTGLRVGVAATQGWAFATGAGVIAVPTLHAVASGVAGAGDALIVPMIDGQRSEVFFSAWHQGVEVLPAAAARPVDAVATIARHFPDLPVTVVGDAVVKYSSVVSGPGWSPRPLAEPLAMSAVRLAASARYPKSRPAAVRPIYVRRPDAEVARDAERRS